MVTRNRRLLASKGAGSWGRRVSGGRGQCGDEEARCRTVHAETPRGGDPGGDPELGAEGRAGARGCGDRGALRERPAARRAWVRVSSLGGACRPLSGDTSAGRAAQRLLSLRALASQLPSARVSLRLARVAGCSSSLPE